MVYYLTNPSFIFKKKFPTLFKIKWCVVKPINMRTFNRFKSPAHGSDRQQAYDWTSGSNTNWYIQEKVDGSQLSFDNGATRFYCRTQPCDKNQLFAKGIEMIKTVPNLNPDYTYHTEYLPRPRSMRIRYARLPKYFVAGYDIQDEKGQFLGAKEMEAEFERCGMESVHCLFNNADVQGSDPEVLQLLKNDMQTLKELSTSNSEDVDDLIKSLNPVRLCKWLVQQFELGNIKSKFGGMVEGCVLKCHQFIYHWDGDTVITNTKIKFVTEEYKEAKTFKKKKSSVYSPQEFIQWLGGHYNTEPRFYKCLQRMKEQRGLMYCGHMVMDGKETKMSTIKSVMQDDLDADLVKEYKDEISRYIESEFDSCGQKYWLNRESNQMIENIFQWKKSKESLTEKLMPYVCEAARTEEKFGEWFEKMIIYDVKATDLT